MEIWPNHILPLPTTPWLLILAFMVLPFPTTTFMLPISLILKMCTHKSSPHSSQSASQTPPENLSQKTQAPFIPTKDQLHGYPSKISQTSPTMSFPSSPEFAEPAAVAQPQPSNLNLSPPSLSPPPSNSPPFISSSSNPFIWSSLRQCSPSSLPTLFP